jgi:hypothetical protein
VRWPSFPTASPAAPGGRGRCLQSGWPPEKKMTLARQRGAVLSSLSREGSRLRLMSAGVIAPLPRSRSGFRSAPAQGVEGIKMEWDRIVARK